MSYAGTAGEGNFDRGKRMARRTWRKTGRIFILKVKKFSKKEQIDAVPGSSVNSTREGGKG